MHQIIGSMLEYAEADKRQEDLFSNEGFWQRKRFFTVMHDERVNFFSAQKV
jgi:hypothetical protein